ncbi:DUF2281 domain-containing protein [Pannus brasiliensis CCIBt3594]|uniref:DUF2281 domain-containing protein n=2 Tax=Pannus TaxID=1427526 RepID=A0AAW9QXN2_9CHRO
MTLKDRLIREIEQIPDSLLSRILDYAIFLKERYGEEEVTEEERESIAASESDYRSGDYEPLEPDLKDWLGLENEFDRENQW